MRFIELPYFTEVITKLISDDAFQLFQIELAKNPTKGDVIQKTGGARKIRIKAQGKGKSKGARIIYYYQMAPEVIVFLFIFPKSKQTDLTPSEKKAVAEIVALIKKEVL